MTNSSSEELNKAREALLARIQERGDRSGPAWEAFSSIPRHLFVPKNLLSRAYEDQALPIQEGVTISQPSLVLRMTELLDIQPHHTVLEVGTGTGYQTALLAKRARAVFTIELDEELLASALDRLLALGITNVKGLVGDGSLGWIAHAPFDRIVVTAAPREMPHPLLDQLNEIDGRMVIPVGPQGKSQELIVVTKLNGVIREERIGAVFFVPLR